MMSLMCKDLGMDCSFKATGTNEREMVRQFIDHAESTHEMSVLSADVIYRVKNAMKK